MSGGGCQLSGGGCQPPGIKSVDFSKLSFGLSFKACHAFVDEMTQGISRRAARSRRPKKLQDAFAQVPFCFARAARIVWRIAPRVGDESFVCPSSLVAGARQPNYHMVAL